MELKLKSTGSTSAFVTWLKGFKDIDSSIIIEIDVDACEFIAKCFPQDRSVIKYSKISFEAAGYELDHIYENKQKIFDWNNRNAETDGRVKVGIYQITGKVIDVLTMFSETEHDLVITFDICKDVLYWKAPSSVVEYAATCMTLKSKSLTMNIKCSQLSEFFQKLDDNTFLTKACNIGSPSVYEVTTTSLANLSKISSVFSIDKTRDKIKFYSTSTNGQRALYASDESNGSYDYLIGYYVSGEDGDTATVVAKEHFLNATKSLNVESLKITLDTAGASRIIIDADDPKIVVGAIKQ